MADITETIIVHDIIIYIITTRYVYIYMDIYVYIHIHGKYMSIEYFISLFNIFLFLVSVMKITLMLYFD